MAPSMIFVLLPQALIVCWFRLEATADRAILHEEVVLGKTHRPLPGLREASSTSSAPKVADHEGLQPEKLEAVSVVGPAAQDAELGDWEAKVFAPDHAGVENHRNYSLSDGSSRSDKPLHDRNSYDADKWVGVAMTLGTQLKNMNATPDDVLIALKEVEEAKLPTAISDNDRFGRSHPSHMPLFARRKPKGQPQMGSSVYAQGSSAASYSKNASSEQTPSEAKEMRRTVLPPIARSRFISEFDDKVKYGAIVKPSFNSLKAAQIDTREVLERVHKVLLDEVSRISRSVDQSETSLPRGEAGRRIVRYIFNSIKREELKPMHFEEACDEFVKFAMGSYEASFGDRDWFLNLDLAPVFTAAAWELFKGLGGIKFQQVRAKTRAAYMEYMDSVVVNKGMWEASRAAFEDDAVHNKVYEAVLKAYKPAYDATIAELGTGSDSARVKHFLKLWISDSMSRAWSSVPDAEDVLTVRNVSRLFQNMLAPFGPDDPFCTIPFEFTKQLGPPPRNWSFIDKEVEALITSWRLDLSRVLPRRSLGDFLYRDKDFPWPRPRER